MKPDGNDANSGTSWALAKKTIQAAINAAGEGDEIWVAAGTYEEHLKNKVLDETTNPLPINVALFGGFAGSESNRDERNWSINLSILDGGGGPFPMPPESGSVVRITGGAGPATRIDGFVITWGHAIGGGGIYIFASGPTIVNSTITRNAASVGGGILVLDYDFVPPTTSHPVITDNLITENSAAGGGGGIAVVGQARLVSYAQAAPFIARNTISRNASGYVGGGIESYGHASPLIFNNRIIANVAGDSEVNIDAGGGGIYATSRDVDDEPISFAVCAPSIVSNVIGANGGYLGAGIYLWDTDAGVPTVTNNTIIANNGIGLYWKTTSPLIRNNLVVNNAWGLVQPAGESNSLTIRNNCVRGERTDYGGIADQTGSNGNISIDPRIANASIGDIRLQPDSPCINKGLTGATSPGWKDIEGQDRVIGNGVDIGADESDGTTWNVPTPVIRVSPGGNDGQDGLTWGKAKRTVAAAIAAAARTGGDVWVAAGTYVERNTLPAFVYLYGGFNGTETSRNQRNVSGNVTILDGGGIPNVVKVEKAGYLVSAVDGFTIQNGGSYTAGTLPGGNAGYGGRGGGIHCFLSMPTVEANTIRLNKAIIGAAISCRLSIPLIVGNTIENNDMYHTPQPTYMGATFGAISIVSGENFLIERNLIKGNTAQVGAGIHAASSAAGRIQNNLITGNVAYDYSAGSGGMGGEMYIEVPASAVNNLYIVNNTITDNTATKALLPIPMNENGGGVALSLPAPLPPPSPLPPAKLVMANNIIAFNSSGFWQYPMFPMLVPALVKNDVYGSTSGTNCNYINLSPGATDISQDPAFVNRPGENFRLLTSSPCKDAEDNAQIPAALTTDFDGNPRIIDGNADGNAVVDMGAFEFTSGNDLTPPTVPITITTSNPTFATSQSIINLGGTASDNVGITRVTWSNDRGGSGTCVGTSSWSANGILLYPGANVLTVTASDREPDGNTGSDVLTVTYTPLQLTISGYVKTSGGSGVEGVIMEGLPGNPATDVSGYYSDSVPAGWSGTVTPNKTGATFSPPSRTYLDLLSDHQNQDYVASGIVVPTITATAPNGGEIWPAGSARAITWTSTDVSGDIKIEYSADGGSNYAVIVAATANDGSYAWIVPSTPSMSCLVRISETDGAPSDLSDATFTIAPGATPPANELVADFGPAGLWRRSGNLWIQLSGVDADGMLGVNTDGNAAQEILADFGYPGLWLWNNGTWGQISGVDHEGMIAADVDGNGKKDIIADFGAYGVWRWDGSAWSQIDVTNNPDAMIAADPDSDGAEEVVADFGFLGLWIFDGGTWKQISAFNPDTVIAVVGDPNPN